MGRRLIIMRHSGVVRATHWINAAALFVLLLSGLQIFNAHPALYWGEASRFADPWVAVAWGDRPGFPGWLTIPSWRDLAAGRRWHFFFAWVFVLNGLVYLAWGVLSGHLRKDLFPRRQQLALRHLWAEAAAHARLRFPKGEAARAYNALQKLSYLPMVLVILPMMLITGLSMSPGFNAAAPWLTDIFGGRQSARTIHFICAWLVVLFTAVHVAMALASGVLNQMRGMITGRYAIDTTEPDA